MRTRAFLPSNSTVCLSVLAFVCLLLALVNSKAHSRESENCRECWEDLDTTVNYIVRTIARDYRYTDTEAVIEEEDGPQVRTIDAAPPVFGRASSTATRLECRACRILLNRLRTFDISREETDSTDLRRLVKKTMLNNGW